MIKFRIKIITYGIASSTEPREDEFISIDDSISVFKGESVCDYNIFIVHLDAVYGHHVMELNINEFDEFLGKPSIILCISAEERLYMPKQPSPQKWVPTFSNYSWLPSKVKFKVINKRGKSLKPTKDSGRFSKLFNEYDWDWQCSFSIIRSTPPSYVSIANNISGQSVALKADIKEGKVIIIPIPQIDIYDSKQYPTFLRLLIDLSREEIEELTEREREEPDWVEKYVISDELELRDKIDKLHKRYKILKEAHKLFYETGKALTRTVNFVLSEMDFAAKMKEDEGTHDIEICEDDCNLVVEVTSSEENWINIKKTRQLLHWCRGFKQERGQAPKGILIANHYCNYPPPERDEPFTVPAVKHAESENFCLMTSEQLYNIFCKFAKGKMDKDKIKQLLLDTKGLLKI